MPSGPARPALDDDRLLFASGLIVSLVRTTRVPEDGREYPLTAHHGEFRLRAAAAHRRAVPADWADRGDVFAPAYDGEAFFASFEGRQPHGVQVEARGVNALSGESEGAPLRGDPQNYLVCPPQRWLDGFYERQRRVRQFSAAVGKDAGREHARAYGLTFRVFPARPEALHEPQPASKDVLHEAMEPFEGSVRKGGAIEEAIIRDPLGLDSWSREAVVEVRIHLVDVSWFSRTTGEPPPPPPEAPPTYR